VTVLDTCGVVAYLDDEPAAGAVGEILGRGDARLTAVGISELLDQRLRNAGESERKTIQWLINHGLDDPVPVDKDIGTRAGIVDCVAAAAASELGVPLATSDAHLLDMAYKEGIDVIPLATSLGRRWAEPRDD
jgi:hypothetical protein